LPLGLLIGRIFSITDRVKRCGKYRTFMITPVVSNVIEKWIKACEKRPVKKSAD